MIDDWMTDDWDHPKKSLQMVGPSKFLKLNIYIALWSRVSIRFPIIMIQPYRIFLQLVSTPMIFSPNAKATVPNGVKPPPGCWSVLPPDSADDQVLAGLRLHQNHPGIQAFGLGALGNLATAEDNCAVPWLAETQRVVGSAVALPLSRTESGFSWDMYGEFAHFEAGIYIYNIYNQPNHKLLSYPLAILLLASK